MKKRCILAVAASLLAIGTVGHATTVEEMQKQLDELNLKVEEIRTKKKSEPVAIDGGYLKKVLGSTQFSGYGELDYIFRRENGNGNGGNTLDPHRIVLNLSSELSDWINFNSELEWEHGGSDGGANGGVSVEQAYLTFKLAPAFNVKTGVMLVPMGAINQNHEPVNFYSSARPALDTFLIPSTWQEMGVGISGAINPKIDYQLMAVTGLDGTKFDAESGLREGRQDFGKDSNRNFAVTGRLDVRPITNLSTAVSFYSGNSAPSGSPAAYTTLLAFDGKYRYSDLELSGEYVHVYQDNPGLLNQSIGRNMAGYWVEGAWHVMPRMLKQGRLAGADAVLFARYSELNTQEGGAVDQTKTSGRFDRNYTTVGISFLPVPSVAIKMDYQIYGDHRSGNEQALDNDKFQVTLGFVF